MMVYEYEQYVWQEVYHAQFVLNSTNVEHGSNVVKIAEKTERKLPPIHYTSQIMKCVNLITNFSCC